MARNAVAPWEGELTWMGEVNSGKTMNGNEWKSIDFVLKYEDSQMSEKEIMFSIFGVGMVNRFLELKIGQYLRVLWFPETNKGKNGRFYSKNSVITFFTIEGPAKSADDKITSPNFPLQQQIREVMNNPQPQPPLPTSLVVDEIQEDDRDLPFNQSPGVRG